MRVFFLALCLLVLVNAKSTNNNIASKYAESIADQIIYLYDTIGDRQYDHNSQKGEQVSETEHALQAASLAAKESKSEVFVLSALLHDIGHLLFTDYRNFERNARDEHEVIAENFLNPLFGEKVSEPAKLNVEGKRYKITVNTDYYNALSPVSKASLDTQGGKLTKEELDNFVSNPHYKMAVDLRNIDDRAKIEGSKTKSF